MNDNMVTDTEFIYSFFETTLKLYFDHVTRTRRASPIDPCKQRGLQIYFL